MAELRSREQLDLIEAMSFPMMDAEHRRSIIDRHQRNLPVAASAAKPASAADLEALGIQVEYVSAKDGEPT
jgi:hypothetical protein